MPYLKKKKKPNRESEDLKRKERQKVYSTKKWKLMRLAYIDQHPTCEICAQKGIITPAVDVHHRVSFTDFEGLKRPGDGIQSGKPHGALQGVSYKYPPT